ncbi:cyclin-D1-binding protein 1 homolog [Poecilia latipinna]|uniref:cyclin-D1-binding protein 1 homolog n=1 Tax=Poecilia latipinna TaxID=48699 RepID=UPI00072DD8CB|nr:PREDICTED: cyclin-D1-binding protein 1 homolog [Poecilia latipinna]
MATESCKGVLAVPLGNALISIQCIRDQVRDGESGDHGGAFDLSMFWNTLNQGVKAVSMAATLVSMGSSKPPQPSLQVLQDEEKLLVSVLNSTLTLSEVYSCLPESQGVTLRRQVRDATVEVLDGVLHLTQEQIMSTRGVWSACDRFARLPKVMGK